MYVQGSTVVGIKVKEGVVIAADKRYTLGNLVISGKAKKVHVINDKIVIGAAWMYADSQAIASILKHELEYYKLSSKSHLSVKGVAKLLSSILYSSKMLPYLTEVIVGGVDHTGPHLYVLDSLGGYSEEKYAALGTGATLSLGLLEDKFKEEITLEEAENLAIEAVKTAIKRDSLSGDGIDIVSVSDKEVKEYSVHL
ncbi:MAG: proteasome subunit beta [Desulfurococcales archaeon]|nr:proteasome subunit beta [Desulfurococcales archaeon]